MVPLESDARQDIDRLLSLAGWVVVDVSKADIHAARGVAIREFPLQAGQEFADYLLYVDGKAAGNNLWRQVLEYFDAHLIGLTATPNKQTFGFFNQNLVMEYGHPQAVADGVNVNYDVYRIKTEVTEASATVEAGYWLQVLDKPTRARRDWQLDDDFEYAPEGLDRSVQTADQIRTIARTLRDRWQTDLFPQRQELPKTLVSAKDDNHAEAIVRILREEWGRGNEYAQKITYRTTGSKPEELIKAFRSSYYPAHRRPRGHDRQRHRHQAGGDRRLHAQREEPQLLRADEGPRRVRQRVTFAQPTQISPAALNHGT